MEETAILRKEALFQKEDSVAIPAAVILHAAVLAVLLLQPMRSPPAPVEQRMTVSLASEVSLEATAPDPVPESAAAIAPVLGEELAPRIETEPTDTSVPETPVPATQPRTSAPAPSTSQRDRRRPEETRAETRTPTPPARASNTGGGSRIGSDFLPGRGSSTTTEDTRIPASQIGASAKASIIQAIVRQIRPHWTAPNGVDAELLVTELAFDLNEDGSLKGRPRVLRQSGDNSANRPQKALHAERAIRAVQLAAPFDLPDEYYNAWKSIRGARFDRNLSR